MANHMRSCVDVGCSGASFFVSCFQGTVVNVGKVQCIVLCRVICWVLCWVLSMVLGQSLARV